MRRTTIGALAAGIAALAALSSPALADTTVVVGQSGDAGWTFNPDPANTAPYEFTTAESSIGNGSLHVFPLTNTPTVAQKFIGALDTPDLLVSDFEAFAFDFLIEGDGTKEEHFYINVYVNRPTSSSFGECRYDFVATTGSTSSFTTLGITDTTTPTAVTDRNAGDGYACASTLAGLIPGSTINFISVNVGDTSGSGSDTGVGGYLDNAELTVAGDTTTYDFDVDADDDGVSDTTAPTDKDQCKQGGYASFNNPSFRNQGDCVSYVNAQS